MKRQALRSKARRVRAVLIAAIGIAATSSALGGCAPTQPGVDFAAVPRGGSLELFGSTDPLITPIAIGDRPMRQLLPNDTSLPGENFLMTMRKPVIGGRMSIAQVLRAGGSLPHPFEYVMDRDLAAVPGGNGSFRFAAAQPADGVSCVLVAGTGGDYRLGVPVLMRNCVRGDLAQALAPLSSAF